MYLEGVPLAPATINLRLAAVRRLAYEASDNGLPSHGLGAGIRRVKGTRRLPHPAGNWLTAEEGQRLMGSVRTGTLRGKRDAYVVTMLMNASMCRYPRASTETSRA